MTRPLPMLDLDHDHHHGGLINNMFGPNGYNNINPSSSCMAVHEIGINGSGDDHDNHGLFFGESGVFGSANIVAEAEIFVPPLESISTTEESYTDHHHHQRIIYDDHHRNSSYNNMVNNINSNIVNCNNNINIKAENQSGVENYFQAELTVGEWDLEDLMKDVSSFPFLDFQIE